MKHQSIRENSKKPINDKANSNKPINHPANISRKRTILNKAIAQEKSDPINVKKNN
jgi:hypothetical protein